MHLLAVTPGTLVEGTEAVDLNQSPGDVVVLSAADTELGSLATARQHVALFRLRLANLLRLTHPLSVDVYGERVIVTARLVVVRLLGGRSYWPYGVERIAALCRAHAIPVAFLPGDDRPDADLAGFSTLPPAVTERLWRYLLYGGAANAEQFLRYAATLIGQESAWREPALLPSAGLYPQSDSSLAEAFPVPRAAIVFYRALVQAGDTAAIDSLREALAAVGLTPMALFVTSFKDPLAAATIREILSRFPPEVILNATGFAQASGSETRGSETRGSATPLSDPLTVADCPVLQVVLASSGEETWRAGSAGLPARDIAMNVALPEIDGRLLSRAIAFKSVAERDPLTECDRVVARPVPDRVTFTARLAAGWVRLRRTPQTERRIVIVLANYPNRDGRIGNGVGLDTPAATVNVLQALATAGYGVRDVPADGAALLERLLAGPTNAARAPSVPATETMSLEAYTDFLSRQPEPVRRQVWKRWGAPERDPFMGCDRRFALPVVRFGQVAVAIQPARGYNIDPASSYHDPALIPPHGYLAFYAWARETFGAHAIVHMGKHGTLEWLPGKAVALSESCWPEVALGPLPHLYPFIVNDPGEGTQAKRRAAAVIVDHLTPPLTRAEIYGPLQEMERLVDEYYEAAGVDPRRCVVLKEDILSLAHVLGLDRDLGLTAGDETNAALLKLDNHLCELKELQIRNGLHIFGESPRGELRRDLLVALARVPRGAAPHEVSLLRALADDLALGFDPLNAAYAEPWTGPRPALLCGESPWRTVGDTVERLEDLARRVVGSDLAAFDPAWGRTRAVVRWIVETLALRVDACGAAETAGLLRGLEGRFVPPGPSGAPTRGRPDVLPTGRNFHSVDTRTVP
ncbi:MAG: cobaltochelatase CobN, partial [Rhodospirillaceae bacterium]